MNNNLINEFRDYKLSVINGDTKFTILQKNIDKFEDVLNFISDKLPNDIISGSLALNLYGLLNRETNDIDILIEDKSRYNRYNKSAYDPEVSTPNRLGYINFNYKKGIFNSEKKYEVDFFLNDYDATFTTFQFKGKTIKIHNPLEIMDYKMNMTLSVKSDKSVVRKHTNDLMGIFNTIKLLKG